MRIQGIVPVLLCATTALAQPAPDPDGNDDPSDTGHGPIPPRGRFERVGRPAGALRRVCDLTAHSDALYLAMASVPLGSDGARVFRYAPGAVPFTLAFDWNRPGEPTRGGGGGQGFTRIRAIEGRLFVPDADPPYAGFGIADHGTEGYVFVSNRAGTFAPPRMPHHRPPTAPDLSTDRPGAAVLPRAYHVLDVIRWRGHLLASTGSVPPRARAWAGPSPGALHVANEPLTRWTYAVGYPERALDDVWRLTYMVRFRGRLYAGLQDYWGRERNDYVVLDAPPEVRAVRVADLRAVRATPAGGAHTLRWYTDRGTLYWVTLEHDRRTHLRTTTDGDHWREVPLPPEAGDVTDVTRWRDGIVALTSDGLWRIDTTPPLRLAQAPTVTVRLGGRSAAVSHFRVDDIFCAAPLAVFRGELYAGSQRDGSLWRWVPEEVVREAP